MVALLAPWLAPQDPTYGSLGGDPDRPRRRPLAGHRPGRARHLLGPDPPHPHQPRRSAGGGGRLHPHRYRRRTVLRMAGGWVDAPVGRALGILFRLPPPAAGDPVGGLCGKGLTAPVTAMAVAVARPSAFVAPAPDSVSAPEAAGYGYSCVEQW
ncbi:hypothetical protein [Streptomyces sp. NPDC047718]|uniref:hypothetical protein n=1 Tax=Streptomyces sp. NPDC047718 TaxID=3155479 RepID=UPI0033DD7813